MCGPRRPDRERRPTQREGPRFGLLGGVGRPRQASTRRAAPPWIVSLGCAAPAAPVRTGPDSGTARRDGPFGSVVGGRARRRLQGRDVDGLGALVAALGVEADAGALGEGLEALRVDAGV